MWEMVSKRTVTSNRRFQARNAEKVELWRFLVYWNLFIREDLAEFWS